MSRSRPINCRRLYEKHHNIKLGDGLVVHHIVPVHNGGSDDISNLIVLTEEEHKLTHMKLYEDSGDFRDLCAYYLIGSNYIEAHLISCSEGGKIGGKKVKELGIGICTSDPMLRKEWASMGGKVGGKVQLENKIGIHAQTKEERLELASRGGKKGAFTQSHWQSEFGKRGGVKNEGFVWLTDGIINIKYTKKQQEEKNVDLFLVENSSFRRGRLPNPNRGKSIIQPKSICSICKRKISNGNMRKHYEFCKNKIN